VGRQLTSPQQTTSMTVPEMTTTVLPQSKAYQEDTSRVARRARVSAYRHRWAILALALLGGVADGTQAATLTALVQAGRQGVVGFTDYVSSSISGPLLNDAAFTDTEYGFPAVSPYTDECANIGNPQVKKGTSGVYGFALKGPTEGAVLLIEGTGTWRRVVPTLSDLVMNGSVVFTSGRWRNTYQGENWSIIDGYTQSDEYGLDSEDRVACPYALHETHFRYSSKAISGSTLNVRFLIDAPEGGLSPGEYTLMDPLYHIDNTSNNRGLRKKLLLDGVNVKVVHYGCTLTAPTSISLDSFNPDATIFVGAQCTDGAVKSQDPITAWLAIERSGVSRNFSLFPDALQMSDGNEDFWIVGNWSSSQPGCNDNESDMYFDGRPGIALGKVSPGQSVDFGVIPLTFRLCYAEDGVSGEYTAQATLSLIQR